MPATVATYLIIMMSYERHVSAVVPSYELTVTKKHFLINYIKTMQLMGVLRC